MKTAVLASLIASAAAFAPAKDAGRTSVALNGAMDDLKSIAEKSNPVLKVSFLNGKYEDRNFVKAYCNIASDVTFS